MPRAGSPGGHGSWGRYPPQFFVAPSPENCCIRDVSLCRFGCGTSGGPAHPSRTASYCRGGARDHTGIQPSELPQAALVSAMARLTDSLELRCASADAELGMAFRV